MCFESKLRKNGHFCYQHTLQPNIIDMLSWDVLWNKTEKSWPILLSAYPTAKPYWYANMGCVLNQNWEKMAISAISIPHSQNFFISYHGMCFETKLRKAGPFCYQHTPQPNLIDMLTWDVFWIKTEKRWPFLLSAYPTAKDYWCAHMGCALKQNWEKMPISAISIPHPGSSNNKFSRGLCFEMSNI